MKGSYCKYVNNLGRKVILLITPKKTFFISIIVVLRLGSKNQFYSSVTYWNGTLWQTIKQLRKKNSYNAVKCTS
jgi:hypothetical protein